MRRGLLIAGVGLLIFGVGIVKGLRYVGGWERPWHVVVLLQNNMELRPTGGYLGSYAEFWLDRGKLRDLVIQDIGWPNGQIKGYVKEPEPIKKYLFKGDTPGWRLRDSNFDPDFSQAARDVNWFMIEGGVEPADIMAAVNLFPVQSFIREMGGVRLVDYKTPITAENLYQQAQAAAESGFFDGSTQKGDFLGALGRELWRQVEADPYKWGPVILKVAWENLATKQILVTALTDPRLEEFFDRMNWNGKIRPVPCKDGGCVGDYLYINEANLGINKTNCCLDRSLEDRVTVESRVIKHQLKLHYLNRNPLKPDPPRFWGGGYKAYVRILVPKGATVSAYLVDGIENSPALIDFEQTGDKSIFGMLVGVPGLGETTVELHYQYAVVGNGQYQLLEQKQSGVDFWLVRRMIQGSLLEGKLDRDRVWTAPL